MASYTGYIGTYTEGGGASRGIYFFSMNAGTGLIEELRPAAESKNPSYLALPPSGDFLYAVNELDSCDGEKSGAVSAYAAAGDGTLKFINRRSSGAPGPCHIVLDREGRFALVSNYSGGALAALPLGNKGSLGKAVQLFHYEGSGPDKQRQKGPHAHSFSFAPDFSGGFACDLGTDRLMLYRFDPGARKPLIPRDPPFVSGLPGYGPRHGVFHPSGRFAYLLYELKSAVDVFACSDGARHGGARQDGGRFERLQTISTLPGRGGKPSSAAAIRIAPGGKFLYASNRGDDSIAAFKILPGGLLELLEITDCGGQHPRDFAPDPRGNFLLVLNKDSDNLVVFRIERRTGLLKREREYAVPAPASVVFRGRPTPSPTQS